MNNECLSGDAQPCEDVTWRHPCAGGRVAQESGPLSSSLSIPFSNSLSRCCSCHSSVTMVRRRPSWRMLRTECLARTWAARIARSGHEGISSDHEPDKIMPQVVEMMRTLYSVCHLVHADLSEYNILWWQKEAWFIDVSQAVEPSYPAGDLTQDSGC